MPPHRPGQAAHAIRLGTAAAALHRYLRQHEDGDTSWTSEADLAATFATAEAAKRFAARRLCGCWHVAEVARASTGRSRWSTASRTTRSTTPASPLPCRASRPSPS